jgi:hypothetical protein
MNKEKLIEQNYRNCKNNKDCPYAPCEECKLFVPGGSLPFIDFLERIINNEKNNNRIS